MKQNLNIKWKLKLIELSWEITEIEVLELLLALELKKKNKKKTQTQNRNFLHLTDVSLI